MVDINRRSFKILTISGTIAKYCKEISSKATVAGLRMYYGSKDNMPHCNNGGHVRAHTSSSGSCKIERGKGIGIREGSSN